MLDIDRRSYTDLVALAIRLESIKRCYFHQSDHVGCGIHRGQFTMMRGQCVLELDDFFRRATRADGDVSRHKSHQEQEPMILPDDWLQFRDADEFLFWEFKLTSRCFWLRQ